MIKQKLNCPKMNTLPKDELSGDIKANINRRLFYENPYAGLLFQTTSS